MGVYKSFGKTVIINDFSLAIKRGSRHAIIGPNGAGKTTLFNIFSGRYEPTSGRIVLNGHDITGLAPYKINRLGMARSFQITNIFTKLTVFENVRSVVMAKHHVYFNFIRNISRWKKVAQETDDLLERTGLGDKRDVLAGNLAYGGAAGARDQPGGGFRSRADPFGRAHGGHVRRRDPGGHKADQQRGRGKDARDHRA